MKYFLLFCLSLVSLTACHVENGYYYDTPSYDSLAYYHRHHDDHRHGHGRSYVIPETRHGHGREVIIGNPDHRAHEHRHNGGSQVIIGGARRDTDSHEHR